MFHGDCEYMAQSQPGFSFSSSTSAKLALDGAGGNGQELAPSRTDHHLNGFAYMMYDTCEPKPAAKCSAYRQSCEPPVLKRRGPSTGSHSR